MLQPEELEFDVVIVGAGPAGLSAARTVARLGYTTLVVERMAAPGELNHPCNAVIVPSQELVPSEHALGGLYFPQVDLLIPGSLIITEQATERYLAPGGGEFATSVAAGPAALIDKAGLLRLLADQAQAAGAHFMWGTSAAALMHEGDRVCGVRTAAGDIRAGIVLAAEGAARALCGEAGLYPRAAGSGRHALVLSQDLDAPAVGPDQLGRIVTLGRLHKAAPAGFGTLHLSAPGRATMLFTLLIDEPDCSTAALAWQHLAEYAHDPRIAGLLRDASVVRRSSFLMPFGPSPASAVRDGLVGVGDAVTPGGYLGILPAIYLGRQAALVAAGALDQGDTSGAALMEYDDFYRELIAPGMEAEAGGVEALLAMSDDELDRLCAALNGLHLPLPFFQSHADRVPAATLAWLGSQLSINQSDLSLVAGLFGCPVELPAAQAVPGWFTVGSGANAAG